MIRSPDRKNGLAPIWCNAISGARCVPRDGAEIWRTVGQKVVVMVDFGAALRPAGAIPLPASKKSHHNLRNYAQQFLCPKSRKLACTIVQSW
jgi:hypothetical protein